MKTLQFAVLGVMLMCAVTCESANYAGWTVGTNAGGYGTILHTANSGVTWTRQGAPGQIADAFLESVYAVNPLTAWVVGGPANGYATIYRTTDGGSTWLRQGSAATLPGTGLGKVIARGNDIWAVGLNAILHSPDGGTTWTNRLPDGYGNITLQGLYTLDGKTVWVSGGSNQDGFATLLKSDDAGLTWARQSGGDVNKADHLLGISAVDEMTLWAVGGTGRGYIALNSIDGGTTWTEQPGFRGLYDINEVQALNDSVVWIAADNAVYWTTDGGENWKIEIAGPYTLDVSAVSVLQAWAVVGGTHDNIGDIWHTSDGGATWEEQGGMTLPSLSGVSFTPSAVPEPSSGVLIAVGAGVFVWRLRRRSGPRHPPH